MAKCFTPTRVISSRLQVCSCSVDMPRCGMSLVGVTRGSCLSSGYKELGALVLNTKRHDSWAGINNNELDQETTGRSVLRCCAARALHAVLVTTFAGTDPQGGPEISITTAFTRSSLREGEGEDISSTYLCVRWFPALAPACVQPYTEAVARSAPFVLRWKFRCTEEAHYSSLACLLPEDAVVEAATF